MRLLLALSLLACLASAQSTAGGAAEIEQLQVKREGADVMIQVVLTGSVKPSVETAINPDRLVLVLPGTVADSKQKHFPLEANGVHAVRVGLNSANPPVTRVVVDLDGAHPYTLSADGKTITLRVQGSDTSAARRSGPVPAASAPLMGVFRRKQPEPVPDTSSTTASAPIPVPPKLPPINFPETHPAASTQASATPASSSPSPSHPKTGSLQQGTVFPGMGTPGSGSVPGAQVATAAPVSTPPANSVTVQNAQAGSNLTPPSASTMVVTAKTPSTAPAASNPLTVTTSATPAAPGSPAVTASAVTTTPAKEQTDKSNAPTTSTSASTSAVSSTPAPKPGTSTTSAAGSGNITAKVLSATVAATPGANAPATPAATASGTAAGATATTVPAVAPATAPTSAAATPVQPTASSPKPSPSVVANSAAPTDKSAVPAAGSTSATATSATDAANSTSPASPGNSDQNNSQEPAATPSVQGPSVANPLGLAPGETVQMADVEPPPPPTTATSADVVPTVVLDENGAVVTDSAPKPTTVVALATEPDPATALALRAAHPDFRTAFKVKYVAAGAAYLDGGRAAGLSEGMKLVVRETRTSANIAAADGNGDDVVAELEVTSVAEASAVTDIHTPKRDVKPGDLAYLSALDEQALVAQSTTSATRKYPTVISFTEGDTLDEEARVQVPRPPMPSVNRARGRFGFDYMGTQFHGSTGGSNTSVGLVARLDMTRIGGTYWNASGYWRGSLTANSYTGTNTLQDLINRTYHIGMTYDNPHSAWVAGFGRMFLPWATSLDTIDGGYFGRRVGSGATVGMFAGSTPDPTSWSYSPNQRIGGVFLNFEGGSFDAFRYTSTSGVGLNTLGWKISRPFVFFENSVSYGRSVSLYDSLQLDSPVGTTAGSSPGPGVGRNFTTLRFQPHQRIEFDANYTYFRDLPTFSTQLIGAGLLDKYLFQGFSGGVRLEVLKQVWLYTNLGRSKNSGTGTTGDSKASLNELYGITLGRLPWVHIRADAHYARFDSAFGSGHYESFSLSRNLNDNFRLELLGGQQNFTSALSSNTNSKFVTSNLEFNFGSHYFLQGGFTASRGATQDYDQWLFTLGYRFDTRRARGQ